MIRVVTLLLVLISITGHACDVGRCYPILEPDLLEEITTRAAGIRLPTATVPHGSEQAIVPCRRGTHHRSRLVDLTITLSQPDRDHQGTILYPAGYRYSPLDMLHYPRTLVVFCGEDPLQLRFVERILAGVNRPILLTNGGDLHALRQRFKQPVYLLTPELHDRFTLDTMPVLVRQVGRMLRLDEYLLTRNTP